MSNFEFDGEKYKAASRHQKEWGNRLISGLVLSGSEAILDIGCGDGVLTAQLAELVPNGRVLGIDASLGMIETAKKLQNDNLAFHQMDINAMDFETQFDVIYSNAALHWVKDHKRLLAASFAALKPNGVISWNFAGDGTCTNFNATAKELMANGAYKAYFAGFEWPWFMPTKSEYEELVSQTGFKVLSLQYENADRYFANVDEMARWIDQPCIVPLLGCLPDAKKQAFRNAFVDSMTEKAIQADGRCFETFKRINIQAQKP